MLLAVSLVLTAITTPASAEEGELKPGDIAPSFSLADQNGKEHSLRDYQGRWLVLYFYPKDDTPGCTTEACRFRDEYTVLLAQNVSVLGVSIDSRDSHERFARKYNLPFPLLADPDGSTAQRYGSYWAMGPIRFAKRHTFIIDPHGRIAAVYRKVDPRRHSTEVIAALQHLQEAEHY